LAEVSRDKIQDNILGIGNIVFIGGQQLEASWVLKTVCLLASNTVLKGRFEGGPVTYLFLNKINYNVAVIATLEVHLVDDVSETSALPQLSDTHTFSAICFEAPLCKRRSLISGMRLPFI
jgi:hypothetical protein